MEAEVSRRLAEAALAAAQADGAEVRLLDEAGQRLVVTAAAGDAPHPAVSLALEESPLAREALAGGGPVIGADVDLTAAPRPGSSLLCLPLQHEGRSLGLLCLHAHLPRRFDTTDGARLTPLAALGAAAVAVTQALAEEKNLEASRAQFVRVATHELRSPVATAQSLVRGVLKGYAGPLTEKQQEVFSRISHRLDFLESLVNDLLDLAAGKAPELGEPVAPVSVTASLRRVVVLWQPHAEEKGLTLTLRVPRDPLLVHATEEGLDRVFVNLVSNAVKYTPTGGAVTVTAERAGGQVEVVVSDTGIGIPTEALPHLFEEFYRAPNAKALGEVGTGLGLAIVRDLVQRYGGRIGVQSVVGAGTTFTVTFPVAGEGSG